MSVLLAGVNRALLHNMLPYLIIEKFFENLNWRLLNCFFFFFCTILFMLLLLPLFIWKSGRVFCQLDSTFFLGFLAGGSFSVFPGSVETAESVPVAVS